MLSCYIVLFILLSNIFKKNDCKKFIIYLLPLLTQERLNASQPRTDLEEKPDKRATDGSKASLSVIPAPPLHPRKPPPRSPTPSTSYSKALTPLPVAPLPSPIAAMKSEDRPKVEKTLPQQPYSHPPSPVPHPVRLASATPPVCLASATPPTASPIRPKEESVEVPEKESLRSHKQPSAPFPSMYPGKCLAVFSSQLSLLNCYGLRQCTAVSFIVQYAKRH